MNKKLLAMLLAVAMIASLAVVPAAAAEKFPDAVGNWAESSIDRWADEGVVQGDANGNVNPGQFLTRAELATVLVRLLGLSEKADAATFTDVAEGDWFADAVLKCAAAKIMLGDGTGRANPNDPITREQAITMVGRALGVKPQSGHSLERFDDAELVSAYAEEYMTPLTAMGILSGVGDGSRVAPQDTIDRASALALLDKAIAHYVTAPGEVKADNANAFVVVNVTDADAADVTVSGETAGVLVTTGNTADVKLSGLSAGTVKVDAPVDVNVDGASKLGSVDVNAAANVDSKGVIGDLQLNDTNATSNVTTEGNKPTTNVGPTYRPGRPSRKKNVEDAEVLFITNADEYKAFFGEDMPTDHNIQLPWLVVSYTRNVAGTVTFSIEKDGETVQFGTVADGVTSLKDTISAEFDAANENAYLSVHLYSQENTDHKGQDWLNQTEAGGSYVATVELDGDEAVSATATYVDKTALNAAITAAEADIAAVATSTDGADVDPSEKWVTTEVQTAYQNAITTAEGVANNAAATQDEVDAAVTALAAATATFEAAKKDGTKPAPTPVVDKTALTDAVAAAKTAIAAVKTSTDGADVDPSEKWVTTEVQTAYQNAITTAEGVANNAAATQDEVDAAVTALATATETFNAAKQDGTKVTKYTITKADATNGSFTVKVGDTEATEAAEGATVEIVPTAESGYEVESVKVDETAVEAGADGKYTFTMPAKNVTVTVTFKTVTPATIQVVPANLGSSDNDFADGPANSLAEGYTATATMTAANTYNVTVTAESLTAHKRSEGADTEDAYWIGFGFLKNDATAVVKVDGTEVPTALNRFQTVGDKTYRTIYTTLSAANTAETFTLTEEDAGGNTLATYNVTMKATALTSPDYTITKGAETNGTFTVAATAKLGATVEITPAAANGYEVESVKVDETAVEAVEGKYTFTMPGKNVTVTVTFKAATVKSTMTFKVMDETAYDNGFPTSTWTGKPAWGTFFENLAVTDAGVVTGKLKYVENFTGFNTNKPNEQEGWYLPIMIAVPEGWAEKNLTAKLTLVKGESGETDKVANVAAANLDQATDGKYITLLQGCTKDSNTQLKVDWDGEGTAYDESDVYTLDISGLEFVGKAMDAGYVVPANLGTEQNSGTTSTLAENYTATAEKVGYQTYAVTVSATSLTAHTSSDPAQAEQGDQFYIGVGLPQVPIADHSLFASTDGGKTWVPVKVQQITLGDKAYSMTYAIMSDTKKTRIVEYKVTADKNNEGDPDGEISVKYTVTYDVTALNPAAAQ